jgi:anaerobic selenocysteine-containing dehydrogenase
VTIENGRIKGFEPLPENKATPEGICLKGLAYFERANSKERITTPLRKLNSGEFEEISWEEALSEIADKMIHFREQYSPLSILFYAASGMSGLVNGFSSNFWRIFGGATTMYGNLCWPAGLEAVRLTLGDNKHNAPWDLENAKLIILWGKNPAETNIHQVAFIEKAAKAGAKVVVIDPRRTQSAEQADLLIQPKPGTDAALALGVGSILVRKGFIEMPFIEKYVKGFEEFRERLLDWTPEKASKICGVPEKYIEKLAGWIGNVKPMTIIPGYGMQRFSNGGQTIRSILSLSVLTGNIGKPGAAFGYANLQSYIFDKVKEPMSYYPPEVPDGIFRRTISMARLGEDMLNTTDPELKMIWVERGNPVSQNPDTNTVLKAFRKLYFRVVVEQFMTDTAMEADIILPAKNMFEQSDIIGSYWNPYVQYKPKVLEPAGDVMPETEIYFRLAQKLGIEDEVIRKNIPEPGDDPVELFLNDTVDKHPGITFDRVLQGPVLPPGHEEVAYSDFVFNTPSGKIELMSEKARDDWGVDEIPGFSRLIEGNEDEKDRYPLWILTPNTKDRIHSQFGNLEMIKSVAAKPRMQISPKDAKDRGIREGDMVRIFNDRGEISIRAHIDPGILTGCIAVYNGLWRDEGAPNFLSKGRETDMGHGTAFHDNLVQAEKI